MYSTFYGLQEKPFALLTDSRFFYKSKIHQVILDELKSCIHNKHRICLLTGDIGTGKTSLIRYLMDDISTDCNVGLITNTNFPAEKLPDRILSTFNQTPGDDLALSSQALYEYIATQNGNNKHIVLILDDSHNLSVPAVEVLYELMSGCFDKKLGISIILCGEPILHEVLKKPDLDSFSKFTDDNFELKSLSQDETANYIRYRIKVAGGSLKLFDDAATNALFKSTGGIPRSINLLCDSALVYGYVDESKTITEKLVNNVVNDRKGGRLFPALSKAEEIVKERSIKENEIARLNAEKELNAEQESVRLKEEQEGKMKAEMELARLKAEEETRLQAEEELARLKAEEEARLQAEEELARLKAEGEAKIAAEEEQAKLREDEEAKIVAEEEQDILRADEEAKRMAEEELDILRVKEEAQLEEETRNEGTISVASEPDIEKEKPIEDKEESVANVALLGSQSLNKPGGKSNLKPMIAAAAIIVMILGFFLFSSDEEEPSVSETSISKDSTQREKELKAQAEEHSRAVALKAKQDEDKRKAAEYEAKHAEEQASAEALRKKLEEEARKNAILEAELKKAEEDIRKKAILEAELKKAEEELRRKAILEAELKKAEEEARQKAVLKAEKERKENAARLKKEQARAAAKKVKQQESINLAIRAAELEAKQKEKAHRKRIKEIQQAEENIKDAFE